MWSRPPCVTGRFSTRRAIVTSVVSRIGIASTSSGRRIVATVVPATVQLAASASDASPNPISWLPESPMKTTAPRRGRRLYGQEAETREAEREREGEDDLVLVLGQRVDREVGAGDDREGRCEAVHVVEEVERVRDAHEPEEADRPREDVVADDLDVQAAREHDDRRDDLRGELRDRAQPPDVVDQPGDEDDRDAGEDPAELARPVDDTRRERDQHARREPGEDPDPAERRRRLLVPALVRRDGDEPRADGRAEEEPEDRDADCERGDRDDRIHDRERVVHHPADLD